MPRSEQEQAHAITRLVDDSLDDAERAAVEEWANQRPEIRRQVALQRRVAQELRSGGPAVPDGLLETVQARPRAPARPVARRSTDWRRAPWLRRRSAVGAAGVLALAAVVVGLVIGISAGSSPSIPGAAKLAFAPATQPAPAAKSSKLLDVSYGGVTYPNYSQQFGAVPTGRRVDRIGGRPALTVYYRLRDGTRLSYTVFSGKPVALPADAKAVAFDGVPLRVFSTPSGLSVVTLVRFGRTCVLAAPTGRDTVLSLAAAPIRAEAV